MTTWPTVAIPGSPVALDEPPAPPHRASPTRTGAAVLEQVVAERDPQPVAAPVETDHARRVANLRSRILTGELLEKIEPPRALIKSVLYSDSLVELWGKPGCGKSFMALDWAMCVGSGKAWQGHATTQAPVLYIVGEGSGGMGKRHRAWNSAWQAGQAEVDFLREAVPLLDPAWVGALGSVVNVAKYGLIVVDTISRSIAGANENDASTMSTLVAHADWLRAQSGGACVMFVHHATKAGDSNRGHSALEGACDLRWKLSSDGRTLTLANEKTKDDAQHPDMTLALKRIPLGENADGDEVSSAVIESHSLSDWGSELSGSEAALVAVMRDNFGTTGARAGQLKEQAALSKTTYYRALNSVLARGELINTGTKLQPLYIVKDLEQQ